MTTEATPAKGGEVVRGADGQKAIRADLVEAYAAMIADVPNAGGEGVENILLQIASAQDLADLDAPWRTHGLEDYIGVPLEVRAIRKLPSDYDGGLPWFLVIDAVNIPAGELVTLTTGAVSVVAQLVKAWQLGAFPIRVIPRETERETRSGNRAQFLEVVGRGTGLGA